jgi:hypothetical protein
LERSISVLRDLDAAAEDDGDCDFDDDDAGILEGETLVGDIVDIECDRVDCVMI